jgi:hypothetical protein
MNRNIYKKSGEGYDARSGTYGENTIWGQPLNPLDPQIKEKLNYFINKIKTDKPDKPKYLKFDLLHNKFVEVRQRASKRHTKCL